MVHRNYGAPTTSEKMTEHGIKSHEEMQREAEHNALLKAAGRK